MLGDLSEKGIKNFGVKVEIFCVQPFLQRKMFGEITDRKTNKATR